MSPRKPAAAPPPDYRQNRKRAQRNQPLALFMAVIVGAVLVGGLLISVSAIGEKIRLSHGLRQIIDIVGTIREAAISDKNLGQAPHEDLIADLARVTGETAVSNRDGVETLQNPWHGDLIGFADAPGSIRIETVVPPYICRRIVDMFDNDPQAFGVRQLDIHQPQRDWQTVYAGPGHPLATDTEIFGACGDGGWSSMAMMFGLR